MTNFLSLENDTLKATILPFGATLTGLWHISDPRSLVLGFDDVRQYERTNFYSGAIVGPVANRIANGRVSIDGHTYDLPKNEGNNTLHSGPDGLHRQHWDVLECEAHTVTLECILPDGACGLPGQRTLLARYALVGNALHLHMSATSDRATLINMVHHPYWAMDQSARLRIDSDRVLDVNDAKIPIGTAQDVAGTHFDVRTPSPVPRELDHCYVLSDAKRNAPARVAELSMPHYTLGIETDAPGLQVYAGAALPDLTDQSTHGWPIAPYSGIALEPQLFPDAPNHPHFPSILVNAGQQWQQNTRYLFSF